MGHSASVVVTPPTHGLGLRRHFMQDRILKLRSCILQIEESLWHKTQALSHSPCGILLPNSTSQAST
ncbi:hypothetical protein GDO78_014230 [Eleutherodactylus coqui]|uniref:Uncharacterized protein n=1 Tax=Eleutherodactylus coqui TaxID=57060 RepID=A0A8J6B6R5_ELECQ|nr:hypothetical protein GDO78_014230 [Eleutherodactylus coqui]